SAEKDRLIKEWTPVKDTGSILDLVDNLGVNRFELLEKLGVDVKACEREGINLEDAFLMSIGVDPEAYGRGEINLAKALNEKYEDLSRYRDKDVEEENLVGRIVEDGEFIAKHIGHMGEVTSAYEMAEVAVLDFAVTYNIRICEPNDKYAVEKELVYYQCLPKEEQDKILAGVSSPDLFSLPLLIKKLKIAEKKELAKLKSESDKEKK
ncbi:hypothetical protein PENTCL1PPCAC_5954, partial [Pristionchus entomophagus]